MKFYDLIFEYVERLVEREGGLAKAAKRLGIAHQSLSEIRRRKGRFINISHIDHLLESEGLSLEDFLMQLVKLHWECTLRAGAAPFVPVPGAEGGQSLVRAEFAGAVDDEEPVAEKTPAVVPLRRP